MLMYGIENEIEYNKKGDKIIYKININVNI